MKKQKKIQRKKLMNKVGNWREKKNRKTGMRKKMERGNKIQGRTEV